MNIALNEHGLASAFNYIVVNLLLSLLAEAALALATLALVFQFKWGPALFTAYPAILVEWIKRRWSATHPSDNHA